MYEPKIGVDCVSNFVTQETLFSQLQHSILGETILEPFFA
jgi:hypothetical protein